MKHKPFSMTVFASACITDVDDEVVEGFSGLDMLPKTNKLRRKCNLEIKKVKGKLLKHKSSNRTKIKLTQNQLIYMTNKYTI